MRERAGRVAVGVLVRLCNRACAVMIGGASERVMILLIGAFHGALHDQVRRNRFEKEAMKPLSMLRRFAYVRQQLGNHTR